MDEELEQLFEKAANHLKSLVGKLETHQLLYFYARFKQAKEGPCNIPKPGFFDFQGKQKWEEWKKLGNKSKPEAMLEYVSEMTNLDPDWEDKAGTEGDEGGGSWVSVSTMVPTDEHLDDGDKNVFDWCKEGEVSRVTELLKKADINQKDTEGMALLHWACDRGLGDMVKLLLDTRADVNIRDQDGQTPLHYATSCGHTSVIKLLLSRNADKNIKDSDGILPVDATDDTHIKELLRAT